MSGGGVVVGSSSSSSGAGGVVLVGTALGEVAPCRVLAHCNLAVSSVLLFTFCLTVFCLASFVLIGQPRNFKKINK